MWPFHPLSFFICWHKKHSECSDIRLSAYMHKEIDVFPLLISYTQTVTEMPKCISKECGFRLLCFILLFAIERPQLHISKYLNTQFCLQCTHHSSKREHIQKFEIKNNTNNGASGKNGRNKTNNNNNITINYKTWCAPHTQCLNSGEIKQTTNEKSQIIEFFSTISFSLLDIKLFMHKFSRIP